MKTISFLVAAMFLCVPLTFTAKVYAERFLMFPVYFQIPHCTCTIEMTATCGHTHACYSEAPLLALPGYDQTAVECPCIEECTGPILYKVAVQCGQTTGDPHICAPATWDIEFSQYSYESPKTIIITPAGIKID